jgi:hypothetical protein
MLIQKHSITSLTDISLLFEYLRDLKLDVNQYKEQREMLLHDIQNKEELTDYKESIRKVLNYLVASISDTTKREQVKIFIQNES